VSEANAFPDRYWPRYNRRLGRVAAGAADLHRPALTNRALAWALCIRD
jgi:hypothetical protein